MILTKADIVEKLAKDIGYSNNFKSASAAAKIRTVLEITE